jgi:multicomponent Na+:H+ antiporter subunit E
MSGIGTYGRRAVAVVFFLLFYLWELIVSSLLLARDIFRFRQTFTHGIVKVEIDLKSDMAILAIVNLLSMTPGSLIVDLSPDRKFLYIHTMYLDDVEKFKRDIKNNFERRIKAIFE